VFGGGGGGEAAEQVPDGQSGLGYGFVARPVGAFEIRDGKARWRPVIDVTAIAMATLFALLLLARWILRGD
jgi:hypothetical protein